MHGTLVVCRITLYVRTILCDTKELGDTNFSAGFQNLYLETGFYIYGLITDNFGFFLYNFGFYSKSKIVLKLYKNPNLLLHSFIFPLFIHRKSNLT